MANPKLPYYIIESGRPDYIMINMANNPEYAALLEKEKKRELKPKHPTVVPRAVLEQTPDMLVEEFVNEETQTIQKRFKEEIVVVQADGRGRIFIEKGKEDLVRKLLRDLRLLDKSVKLDEEGLQLQDEMTEEERSRINRGGRPKKST